MNKGFAPHEITVIGGTGFLATIEVNNVAAFFVSFITLLLLLPDFLKKYAPNLAQKWFPHLCKCKCTCGKCKTIEAGNDE